MPVVCHFLLKKSFITGITILQPLYLLYIYAILIPNWGINEKGEFIALKMTKGNVDDRVPVLDLTRDLTGFIYADKGYIKQNLFINLYERGLKMVHGIKKNMPNKLIDLNEKILLRKRNIIETVFDYLKNKMNLEHTRHRSPINAFVHILSTFISYCFKKNKPSINYGFDLSLNYALIPN